MALPVGSKKKKKKGSRHGSRGNRWTNTADPLLLLAVTGKKRGKRKKEDLGGRAPASMVERANRVPFSPGGRRKRVSDVLNRRLFLAPKRRKKKKRRLPGGRGDHGAEQKKKKKSAPGAGLGG